VGLGSGFVAVAAAGSGGCLQLASLTVSNVTTACNALAYEVVHCWQALLAEQSADPYDQTLLGVECQTAIRAGAWTGGATAGVWRELHVDIGCC
jgi:hypothetical protein